MLKTVLCGFLVVLTFFAPTIAFAKTTGWINLSNKKEARQLQALFDEGLGRGVVTKKVECKAENGNFYIRLNYSHTRSQSNHYLRIGFWKNLEPEYLRYKKRGAVIVSRSDIETKKGLFTCIIWRKWY